MARPTWRACALLALLALLSLSQLPSARADVAAGDEGSEAAAAAAAAAADAVPFEDEDEEEDLGLDELDDLQLDDEDGGKAPRPVDPEDLTPEQREMVRAGGGGGHRPRSAVCDSMKEGGWCNWRWGHAAPPSSRARRS